MVTIILGFIMLLTYVQGVMIDENIKMELELEQEN